MNKREKKSGLIVGGLIVLILLLVVGIGWWFFQTKFPFAPKPPADPGFIFIVSPSSGDEIAAGDYVPVIVQSISAKTLKTTELFVDGQSAGTFADPGEKVSWSWHAWPVGIHTLVARMTTTDGRISDSQTVILSVIAEDGFMELPAQDGVTLAEIGADYGIPKEVISGANPLIDPDLPLQDGQPIKIPILSDAPKSGDNGKEGTIPPNIPLITWQFKPLEPVDKSYCYLSSGNGQWTKFPKQPFDFLFGSSVEYIQHDNIPIAGKTVLQIQCWGWLGDTLKFLGQGETPFDPMNGDMPLVVVGKGFQLNGVPKITPKEEKFTGGVTKSIPDPFAMREPSDTKDCTKHYGNILAGFVCDALLKAPVKQYYVLEWEWQPQVNWPGNESWINDIDGYRIFEIDPLSKKEKLIANVSNPKQKVVAVPLPWGSKCYGVKAYIDDPILEPSQMATYCPGKPPTPQKITLNPVDWLTTGGTWVDDGDCDGYGGLSQFDAMKKIRSNFGQQPGDVLVGSYIVDDEEDDCYREGTYTGGVKFSTQLPMNATVQKAVLRFPILSMDYYATGLAAPKPSSCVASIGKAKQDWSNAVPANHYSSYTSLGSFINNTPVQTISAFMANEIDVTSLVNEWVSQPEKNFGLILSPAKAPYPLDDGSGTCMSGLQNIKLDVYYFAPP